MTDSTARRYGASLYRRRPSKSRRRNPTTVGPMIATARPVLSGHVPGQVNALFGGGSICRQRRRPMPRLNKLLRGADES